MVFWILKLGAIFHCTTREMLHALDLIIIVFKNSYGNFYKTVTYEYGGHLA